MAIVGETSWAQCVPGRRGLQPRLPIGDLIKVLAALENGERRFSIDMQVLTDLKRATGFHGMP